VPEARVVLPKIHLAVSEHFRPRQISETTTLRKKSMRQKTKPPITQITTIKMKNKMVRLIVRRPRSRPLTAFA